MTAWADDRSSIWSPFLGDRPGETLTFIVVEVTKDFALLCSQLRFLEQAPNPTSTEMPSAIFPWNK